MSIKILDAKQVRKLDPDGEFIGSAVTAQIEIDDLTLSVGGLDPSYTRQELEAHLESRYAELLAVARKKAVGREIITRLDLINVLPESAHYAQLTAVHPAHRFKAEVRRYFMGQWYDGIRCLTSHYARNLYPGPLKLADISILDPLDPANKDSWVKVDFITENFNGERVIPIVMDKVEL